MTRTLESVLHQLRQLEAQAAAGSELDYLRAAQRCAELHDMLEAGGGADMLEALQRQQVPALLARVARHMLDGLEPYLPHGGAVVLQQHEGAPLLCLGSALTMVARALRVMQPTHISASSSVAGVRFAQQLVAAGLLPVLQRVLQRAVACMATPDGLQLAPVAAVPAAARVCWSVCSALVELFGAVAQLWPGGVLASAVAGPAVLPYVQLCSISVQVAAASNSVDDMRYSAKQAVGASFNLCTARRASGAAQQCFQGELQRSLPYLRLVLTAVLVSSAVQHAVLTAAAFEGPPRSSGVGASSSGGGSARPRDSSSSGASSSGSTAAAADQQPYLVQLCHALGLPAALALHVDWGMSTIDCQHLWPLKELACLCRELLPRLAAEQQLLPDLQQLLPPALLVVLSGAAEVMRVPPGAACCDANVASETCFVCAEAAGAVASVLLVLSASMRAELPRLIVPLQHALPLAACVLEACVAQRVGNGRVREAAYQLVLVLWWLAHACMLAHADCADAWQGVAARLFVAAEAYVRHCFPPGRDSEARLALVSLGGVVAAALASAAGISTHARLLAPAAGGSRPELPPLAGLVVSLLKVQLQRCIVATDQLGALTRGAAHLAAHLASRQAAAGGAGTSGSDVPWLVVMAHGVHFAGTWLARLFRPEGAAVQARVVGGPVLLAGGDGQQRSLGLLGPVCLSVVQDLLAAMHHCCGGSAAGPAAGQGAAPAPASAVAVAALWASAPQQLQMLEEVLLPALRRAELLLCHAAQGGSSPAAPGNSRRAATGDDAEMAAVAAAAASSEAELRDALRGTLLATSLPEQLCSWAAGVCAALPHRFACNNPGCTSLVRTSESALVGGRSNVCSGCRTARYCSTECQAAHWRHHKPVCRRLKRDAAAAAAAAAGAADMAAVK